MRDDYPGRIYCSQACSNHAQDDIQRKKNKRACKHCGKSFFAAPIQIFCSHACYCADKRKRFPKECPVCGVIFMPHRPEQKTCSKACAGKRKD